MSSVDPTLPNPAAGGLPGAYTFYGTGPGRNGQPRIGNIYYLGFQPRKDYRSAVTALTHYVSTRKDDATTYYLLSRAYRALGDKEEMRRALASFEKTSQDAKARNRAQEELEPLIAAGHVLEEKVDLE